MLLMISFRVLIPRDIILHFKKGKKLCGWIFFFNLLKMSKLFERQTITKSKSECILPKTMSANLEGFLFFWNRFLFKNINSYEFESRLIKEGSIRRTFECLLPKAMRPQLLNFLDRFYFKNIIPYKFEDLRCRWLKGSLLKIN